MTSDLLNAQEGGKAVLPGTPEGKGLSGPSITPTGIKMKIKLVNDGTTLPSYLVPTLTCGTGDPKELTPSTIVVTLKGDNLQKLNKASNEAQISKFKCEMISDFLIQGEKSAITIETYYVDASDSSGTPKVNINTIYFDDSLLSYYDSIKTPKIQKSTNPFLITANTADNSGTYTFRFDFDAIIDKIKGLESYKQIQKMFMFVNGIDSTKISSTINQTTLIKISEDAYLNLNFNNVPFDTITTKPGPYLTISTDQPKIDASKPCDLKLFFGTTELATTITETLKPVLSIEEPGYNFDCSSIYIAPAPINPSKPPSSPAQQPPPGPGQASDATLTARSAVNASIGKAADILSDTDSTIQSNIANLPPSVKSFTSAIKMIKDNTLDPPAAHKLLEAVMTKNPNLKDDIDNELAKNTTDGPMKTLLTEVKNIHSSIPVAMGPALAATASASVALGPASAVRPPTSATVRPPTPVPAARQVLVNGDSLSNSSCSAGDIAMYCDGTNDVMRLEVPYKMIISKCFQGNMQAALLSGAFNSSVDSASGGAEAAAASAAAASAAAAVPEAASAASVVKQSQPQITQVKISSGEKIETPKPAATAALVAALDASETDALAKATTDLTAQQSRLTNAKIATELDALNKLKTAIQEAGAVVTALPIEADDAAKATALNNAKSKIELLAGLVTAATMAVDEAIAAAAKPADDPAKKIQELTDKLQKDATDVLDAAQKAYEEIIAKPDTPIEFTIEEGLITTATAAIAKATTANAAGKAAAIVTATNAVDTAIAAATKAKAAVDAAVTSIPNRFAKADAAVKKAIQLVPSDKSNDTISEDVKNAAVAAAFNADDYNKLLTSHDFKITDAVAAINDMGVSVTNSKIIILLQTLDNALTESEPPPPPPLPESATPELDKAIQLVTAAISATEAAEATEAATKATEAATKAAEAATKATEATEATEAVIGAATKVTEAATKVTDAAKAVTAENIKPLLEPLKELKTALEALQKIVKPESGSSLFDGGSNKPKSTTKSSSKSSSKPKPSSKNKTKKNHPKSNPNPNKNKTPKIKMNE